MKQVSLKPDEFITRSILDVWNQLILTGNAFDMLGLDNYYIKSDIYHFLAVS